MTIRGISQAFRQSVPIFGVLALLASLGLHFVVMVCFAFRWDKVAAVTIIPFFLWAVPGIVLALLGWGLLRTKHGFFMLLIWLVSVAACSDESYGLVRSTFATPPEPGQPPPYKGREVLRVVTLNCGDFQARTKSPLELEPFEPDIVFLQETPHYRYVYEMTKRLYGDEGTFVHDVDCSILARGTLVKSTINRTSDWFQVTLKRPDGVQVELLNVHLANAVTDLKLWQRATWRRHKGNRRLRRMQILTCVQMLLRTAGHRPAIIAGDFNAPPTDAVFRHLREHFTDSYRRAGTGWGNTFSNSFPLLRIDQIWSTPELIPVRQTTVKSGHSDHRFIVCDLVVEPGLDPPG